MVGTMSLVSFSVNFHMRHQQDPVLSLGPLVTTFPLESHRKRSRKQKWSWNGSDLVRMLTMYLLVNTVLVHGDVPLLMSFYYVVKCQSALTFNTYPLANVQRNVCNVQRAP